MIDPALKARFLEFLGRDPHPTGAGRAVWNLSNPRLPQYRFEWHPQTRRVYLARLNARPVVGEVIAFNIETHGDAINAVNIWTRGFNEGRAPDVIKPNLAE